MKLTTTLLGVLLLSGALAIAQDRPSQEGGRRPQRQQGQQPGDEQGAEGRRRPMPPPEHGPRMMHDPMMECLFPPPVIMQHAEAIKLTEEQKNGIKSEMEKTHEQVESAEKKVREEVGELKKLLTPARVDEAAALAQLDKVLAAEAEVKKLRLGTSIRIKNILTEEQQEQLRKLMREHFRPRPPFGPRDHEDGPRRFGGDQPNDNNDGARRGGRDAQRNVQRNLPTRPAVE